MAGAGRICGALVMLGSILLWSAPNEPVSFSRDVPPILNKNCLSCHGPNGVGTTQGPPLVHRYYVPSHHADEAFRRAIRFGVVPHHWHFGPMPPVEGLDDREVAGVIAYLRWLQRQQGIA